MVPKTAFEAASAKLSAVSLGYYSDPYISHFVTTDKPRRHDPIIHRGYYIRVSALRQTISEFLQQFPSSPVQIINFGCGMDSIALHFLLSSPQLHDNVTFIEIDLPDIVRKKSKIIAKHFSNQLEITSHNSIGVLSPHYKLSVGDITDLSSIQHVFDSNSVHFHIPTLVVFECVLVYLNPIDSSKLLSFLQSCFPTLVSFVYDPIRPFSPFGKNMVRHAKEMEVDFVAINEYPDLYKQRKRYLDLGFNWSAALDLWEVEKLLVSKEEAKRLHQIELLVEIEEYMAISSQYCLVISGQGVGVMDWISNLPELTSDCAEDLIGIVRL
ncbi:hypothetical protein RCL1_002371 [Eukaryota sp. TZLM3-RCL]